MELHQQNVRERLEQLSERDHKRKVFGAVCHEYILNPPLGVEELEAFEIKYEIALPVDYKLFITEIGNGGAGPAYGLFPFGQHDDSNGLLSWKDGDLVGDIGKPFPHTEAWNLTEDFWDNTVDLPPGISEEDEDKLWAAWDQKLVAKYWNPGIMNGAIPICHLGCALRQWLVVHGPQRGFVWDDMRADEAGLAPAKDAYGKQMTFTDWYLAWLEKAEHDRNTDVFDTHASSRRELVTMLLLIVAGVVLGLLSAIY